jgi:hypothetical protein
VTSDAPEGRPQDGPRPTPRPRAGAAPRPSPRPRVAGSRRDRDEAPDGSARTTRQTPAPRSEPVRTAPPEGETAGTRATARPRAARGSVAATVAATDRGTTRRRLSALVVVLALASALAAVGAGLLLWQRLNPGSVDSSIFTAARSGIEAVYAYDYEDSEGSVQGKLDVLTGELREEYERDLTEGGIIETYEQVSATTRYEVLDVGLQQVNGAQDTATLVVFGQYVVESVNSGSQPAPEGSECQITPAGAQSCTQTVRVTVVDVDGEWKINELTLLTTS